MQMKRYYNVYFEIFGKKLKVKVFAENEEKARQHVIQQLQFHKIELVKDTFNDCADILEGFMNVLKK